MLRVRTVFSGATGAPYLSTLYFAGTNGDDADAAASAVSDYWIYMSPIISTAVSFVIEGDVAVIDEEDGTLLDSHPVSVDGGSGSASGDMLPFTTQGLQRWATGQVRGGRVVRGRTFVPGAVVGNNDSGVPDAAYVAKVIDAGNTLIADADSTLLVWTRKNQSALEVTAAGCWSSWAELRSRRD